MRMPGGWRVSYVAESDAGKRSACEFVSRGPKFTLGRGSTHHDRSRGQSPLRHPGCIHCAQTVPISPVSQTPSFWRVCAATYVVERAELRGGLVQAGVGREDRAATLSLVANDPTHGDVVVRCRLSMERSTSVGGLSSKFFA
jgi:hypothetical protein